MIKLARVNRWLWLVSMSMAVSVAVAVDRPNVVIIYGDDVGFGDVGAYGSKMIPTPNIDRLAAEGVRFTDGHSSASTCSPSRFSMLTGVHGFRYGLQVLSPEAGLSIPLDALTLPKLFKKAGYATGVVGKWHLGLGAGDGAIDWNGEVKPGPIEVGFDFSFLIPSTNDRVPCVLLDGHRVVNLDPKDPLFIGKKRSAVDRPGSTSYPDGKTNPEAMTYFKSSNQHADSVINGVGRIGFMAGGKAALWNDETLTDQFVQQARSYILDNKDKPFLLYFASQCIHVPRMPNPRFRGATGLGYRGDSMVEFDWATGEIMGALEEAGVANNTIVIFSSDNGPVYNDGYLDGTAKTGGEIDRGHDGSGHWRGGKYQIYEGGTRVPFIVRWPSRIKPGVSTALVNQIDLMASFAALLAVPLGENEARDSRNILGALLGEDNAGLDFMLEESKRAIALRSGQWKYIADIEKKTALELYNLEADPGEKRNLLKDEPEKAQAMEAMLREILAKTGIR